MAEYVRTSDIDKQPLGTEELLRELVEVTRNLQPPRRRIRRALAWVLVACATPIVANYAVTGAHQSFVTAVCYVKYLSPPGETRPLASAWESFGATSVKTESPASVSIKPAAAGDIWFGAAMPFTRYCDYSVSFSAELVGALQPDVAALGYGYSIGVKGTVINGVPSATTVQYDPLFDGIRIVPIPCCANSPGYNALRIPGVVAGRYYRWTLKVIGSTAYISFDGKGYGSMNLGDGDEILLRVWNAQVLIKNLSISAVQPW